MIPFQQLGRTARLERNDPVEKLPQAHADRLGDLRCRKLAAGRQTHGQQAPVGVDVFDLS
jgi:hypothetical protein